MYRIRLYRLGLTPGQLRRFVLTLHGGGGDDGKRIRKNVSPGGPIAILLYIIIYGRCIFHREQRRIVRRDVVLCL